MMTLTLNSFPFASEFSFFALYSTFFPFLARTILTPLSSPLVFTILLSSFHLLSITQLLSLILWFSRFFFPFLAPTILTPLSSPLVFTILLSSFHLLSITSPYSLTPCFILSYQIICIFFELILNQILMNF